MHAVPEEDLGAIDVAHSGDHRLVHQQLADRALAPADPLPRPARVGVNTERVRAQRGDDLRTSGATDQVATRGAAQVGVDRKSTRLNSSHYCASRMPSSA